MKCGLWPIHTAPVFDEDLAWIDDIKPEEVINVFSRLKYNCTFKQL